MPRTRSYNALPKIHFVLNLAPDYLTKVFPTLFFIHWFEENGRSFPWRKEGLSSFHILVTEILLRQTRADQVAAIWPTFIEKYHSPDDLARAGKDDLYDELKGLGFGRQRAEALNLVARHLLAYHHGSIPSDIENLLATPHVGLYVAHAVQCFAYRRSVPVLDLNILRLFARFTGYPIRQNDIRRNPWAWDLARTLLPSEADLAVKHNYGLLDFTGMVCKPSSPRCPICPLNSICVTGRASLPGPASP